MFRLYCEAGRSRLPGREADIARVAAAVYCPPGKGGQPLPTWSSPRNFGVWSCMARDVRSVDCAKAHFPSVDSARSVS